MKKAVFAALVVFLAGCGLDVGEVDQPGGPSEGDSTATHEGAITAQESAVAEESTAVAAKASGWTWTYSATVGVETYVLKFNGNTRGFSTARSNATITLGDRSADSLGQRVYWRVKGAASWRICDNTGGNESEKTCNVTNNKFIQYQFCMKDGNTIIACAPVDGFQT